MPKVGKKEFSYSDKGKAEAKAYAKKTGQEVEYPTYDASGRVKVYREGGKVNMEAVKKAKKKYYTDPKTGITDLSKRAGKESPGYKKGKYWLRKEGKYVDTGSEGHIKDLKERK